MLPPSYLDQMPDAFVQLWQQVEDDILRDVARRISKMEALTPTANWQLWRYQQTEALRNDVVKLLAKYTGKSETAIRKLLLQAATEAMEREDAIYYHYDMEPPPFEESAALNNLLDAGARQTCGTWQNLTATTANTVTGAFERTLDAAWLKVSTGAFDYKAAVKQAVDSLADEMPMVTYPSGHKDSIEVAARRAILTGVNQTAGKLQVARADEMGVEFFETTAHGGARPSHAEWQGRQFHRGGAVDYKGKHYPDFEAATGYGTGAGLCGWNCRHQFFACFPELGDPPAWTREQLETLNARNIEWNGKKYTAYEISQMQRARERSVRRWKKRYLAEDAAGLDPTDAAVRLRAARQSLAEFAQATGGRVDSARVSVPKFGRSEASRASAQVRKASSTYSSLNTKAKPVTMQSIANVKAFSCDTLDAAGQQQLKNAHKRLLMVASKQPENVEVGRVFDIKMKPLTKDITGSAEGSSVQLPNFDTPYVVIHTHPACGIFSHGDLLSFTRNKNLKLMTAIGHNGHIYAVEKSINYDAAAANGIVWGLNAEINRLKNIPRAELSDEKLLEQAEKLIRQAIGDLQENGVKYYE
ncbi:MULTISPECIES: phage minor capsid protein [unclassified Faecalibacterium]|uniref:phage minor capsid protein n=1 Tax=unclassified Faecalibacterium TaxID=2646395 RepID=UPI001FA9DB23|nr:MULTISPECIES: phage minor capsid protein [unclassified Faecalibacterium]